MLRIYNSLTNQKEEFKPIQENKIGIYVCGMTVYDYCHLGHARVMVVFDSVIRYLRYRGYEVTYVRNITDIDDKIITRANEIGESVRDLTDRFIDYMNEDLEALGIQRPNVEPRATEYVPEILDMIARLVERGHAYLAENGDVYYRTKTFDNYGALSGRKLDELKVGARIEPDEAKEDPLDFVLWKHSKAGEPAWDSPWGKGRPGWHIECSAMSTSLLGNHFDIHAGGMDLLFPHHENEIAQAEGATGEKFVNTWMHNGYLQIDSEKMSKSLKNFFTIREILAQDSDSKRMGEVLRYLFLSSHYRSPLNYSEDSLENAKAALRRIYLALDKAREVIGDQGKANIDAELQARFNACMDDDFNTAEALAVVFDGVRELNRAIERNDNDGIVVGKRTILELASALGLGTLEPQRYLVSQMTDEFQSEVITLIEDRLAARRERDWSKADSIRNLLTDMGVELEDKPDGSTVWRKE